MNEKLQEINHLEKIVGVVNQTTIEDIICEGETETDKYITWLRAQADEIIDDVYVRMNG
jgi:hypothetical protein